MSLELKSGYYLKWIGVSLVLTTSCISEFGSKSVDGGGESVISTEDFVITKFCSNDFISVAGNFDIDNSLTYISFWDARYYDVWSGENFSTELEREAARSGKDIGHNYFLGDEMVINGKFSVNIKQWNDAILVDYSGSLYQNRAGPRLKLNSILWRFICA